MPECKIGVVIHTKLRDQLFTKEDMERLEWLGEVVWTGSPDPLPVDQAVALLSDCDVGIGSWGTPGPTSELLPQCPKLRLWVHAAGSVKKFFGPHLKNRDMLIASCAPAIADNVAEFTLGLLTIGLKRALPNAAANRKGKAPKPEKSLPLGSSTIGVVGASQVGRRVLDLLKSFGTNVLLYDPYCSEDEAAELGAEKCEDLTELCSRSDAVTLHTPATPETEKMMGSEQFEAMADDAILVNTARGKCVDEEALIAELKKGRLFAFLDVTDPEPADDDSPLRKLDNVVLTSHIAGNADIKIGRQAVDDVERWLNGKRPLMAPTESDLHRLA
ncbi:MAG: hydroxyacid dehydrogenase [Phycisphaerae bacterium]